jgi:hypothetical protein
MKGGYLLYISSTAAAIPLGDYTVTGTPIIWSKTGQRNFCSTEDGVIKTQLGGNNSLAAGVTHATCVDPAQYAAL